MKQLIYINCIFFSIASAAQVTNPECEDAIEVFCGDNLFVNLDNGDGDYSFSFYSPGDCDYTIRDDDVWYKIVGTGDVMTISYCNFSTRMLIFENDCSNLICPDNVVSPSFFNCGQFSEELSFLSTQGQTYFISCASINPQLQSELKISCQAPALNNSCGQAVPINLDNIVVANFDNASYIEVNSDCFEDDFNADIWFTFQGSGELLVVEDFCDFCSIRFNIYTGNCNDLSCVEFEGIGDLPGFQSVNGEQYYIRMLGLAGNDESFKIRVAIPPVNDLCEDALQFNVGDTLCVNNFDALNEANMCGFGIDRNGVWYTFTGTGDIHLFDSNDGSFNIDIIAGTCQNPECQTITQYPGAFIFETIESQEYLLRISQNSSPVEELKVFQETYEAAENNSIENAIPIMCADSLISTLVFATENEEITGNRRPYVWFTLTGTDEFYSFESAFLSNPQNLLNIYIFEDTGNELVLNDIVFDDAIYLENGIQYFIGVSDFSFVDSFYLKLDCEEARINDVCSNALPLNITSEQNICTFLTAINTDDECGVNPTNTADVWYVYEGEGTLKDVTFDRSEGHILSIFEGDCDQLVCYSSVFNSFLSSSANPLVTERIFFEVGVTYYFKVSHRFRESEDDCTFITSVDVQIADNDQCVDATLLTCGISIRDSLQFALNNEESCTNTYVEVGGIWFNYIGTGTYVEVNVLGGVENVEAYTGTCSKLNCEQELLRDYRGKKVFFGNEGVEYFFLINQQTFDQTDFEFQISCIDSLTNNTLETALDISCGDEFFGYSFIEENTVNLGTQCTNHNFADEMWFTIQGNNEYLYIDEDEFYENAGRESSCGVFFFDDFGNLSCLGFFQDNRIFLPVGNQYYLRFCFFEDENVEFDFDIHFDCYPQVEFDNCETAITLECGDVVEFDRTHASDDDQETPCGGTVPGDRAVWFRVIGDGLWKDFQMTDSLGEEVIFQIWSYEGSCGQLTCIPYESVIPTEIGTEYFLSITGGYLGFTTVSMTCVSTSSNDLCHNAQLLSCGDVINGTLDYSTSCSLEFPCNPDNIERVQWFKLVGNNESVRLDFTSFAFNSHSAQIQIFENGCCDAQAITSQYGSENTDVSFFGELDKEYLVRVGLGPVWDNGDFDLALTCFDNMSNTCENAPLLSNGQIVTVDPTNSVELITRNLHDELYSFVKFIGSGGIDTVSVSGSSQFFQVDLFVDFDGNCSFSLPLTFSTVTEYLGDRTNVLVPTIANQEYIIGVSADGSDLMQVGLNQSNSITQTCTVNVPKVVRGLEQNSLDVQVDIAGNINPISGAFIDPYFGNLFSITSSQLVQISHRHHGIKLLEYRSLTQPDNSIDLTCSGHIIYQFDESDEIDCIDENVCDCQEGMIEVPHPNNPCRSICELILCDNQISLLDNDYCETEESFTSLQFDISQDIDCHIEVASIENAIILNSIDPFEGFSEDIYPDIQTVISELGVLNLDFERNPFFESIVTLGNQEFFIDACASINISDPCNCLSFDQSTDLFTDTLIISGLNKNTSVTLDFNNSGFRDEAGELFNPGTQFVDDDGNGHIVIPFFRSEGEAVDISIDEFVFTSVSCPGFESCLAQSIPTLSEWSLIWLALLLLIFSVQFISESSHLYQKNL